MAWFPNWLNLKEMRKEKKWEKEKKRKREKKTEKTKETKRKRKKIKNEITKEKQKKKEKRRKNEINKRGTNEKTKKRKDKQEELTIWSTANPVCFKNISELVACSISDFTRFSDLEVPINPFTKFPESLLITKKENGRKK